MSPSQTIYCKECGRKIRGYDLSERMDKLRMHKRLRHPKQPKKVKRGR